MQIKRVNLFHRKDRLLLKKIGVRQMSNVLANRASDALGSSISKSEDAHMMIMFSQFTPDNLELVENKIKISRAKYKLYNTLRKKLSSFMAQKAIVPSLGLNKKLEILGQGESDYVKSKNALNEIMQTIITATFQLRETSDFERIFFGGFDEYIN